MIIFLCIIACVVIYLVLQFTGKSGEKKSVSTNNPSNASEIAKDFANEAIQFFDGYLCLCQHHPVKGNCSVLSTGVEDGVISARIECRVIQIDNEHADEVFRTLRDDEMIKSFFGCAELHYAFTEVDEYTFEDGWAIISFERSVYILWGGKPSGIKWMPTLQYIRQELQRKWPNASIDVGNSGIIVEA